LTIANRLEMLLNEIETFNITDLPTQALDIDLFTEFMKVFGVFYLKKLQKFYFLESNKTSYR
jgi:hypothetical protein